MRFKEFRIKEVPEKKKSWNCRARPADGRVELSRGPEHACFHMNHRGFLGRLRTLSWIYGVFRTIGRPTVVLKYLFFQRY